MVIIGNKMSKIRKHRVKKGFVKKEKKKPLISKQMLWTFIISGLMIASGFGIMFSSFNSGNEPTEYGDYRFVRTQTGWATDIEGTKAEFTYLPAELEGLNISGDVKNKLDESMVFIITFDPNTKNVENFELMRFELARSMSMNLNKQTMPGVSVAHESYTHQPLIDCLNATARMPVISIKETNTTDVYLDGDCIVLETNSYNAIALKDRIMYSLLGIMS